MTALSRERGCKLEAERACAVSKALKWLEASTSGLAEGRRRPTGACLRPCRMDRSSGLPERERGAYYRVQSASESSGYFLRK